MKAIDISSNELFKASLTGKGRDSQIDFCKDDATHEAFITLKLKNTLVSSAEARSRCARAKVDREKPKRPDLRDRATSAMPTGPTPPSSQVLASHAEVPFRAVPFYPGGEPVWERLLPLVIAPQPL